MTNPKPIHYKGFVIYFRNGDWYVEDPKETDWKKKVLAAVWSSKDGKQWIDRHLRESNPLKLERCVQHVKASGSARNAWAVCTAALKREKNPLSNTERVKLLQHLKQHEEMRRFKPFYIVTAARGTKVLYLTRDRQLSNQSRRMHKFADSASAEHAARALLRQHPQLRAYTFNVRVGY